MDSARCSCDGTNGHFVTSAKRKKFPSRSRHTDTTIKPDFNMTKALLLTASLATLVLATGCSLLKRTNRAKESSAISADVEASFHRRWVEKRTAELTAGGANGAAARTQAEAEFRERFGYTRVGGK
jgi:hypothetical protein